MAPVGFFTEKPRITRSSESKVNISCFCVYSFLYYFIIHEKLSFTKKNYRSGWCFDALYLLSLQKDEIHEEVHITKNVSKTQDSIL